MFRTIVVKGKFLAFLLLLSTAGAMPVAAQKAPAPDPFVLENNEESRCRIKNWLAAAKWKAGFEGEFRKHERRYWDAINHYEETRREFEKSLVTFTGLKSTSKAAYYQGYIAQHIKTIANLVQDILGFMTGGQGTAVNLVSGIAEEVATGLRDKKTTWQITKPIAVRTGATLAGTLDRRIAAASTLYNLVSNYRRLRSLQGEWEDGVNSAREAHTRFDNAMAKIKAALGKIDRHRAESDKIYQTILDGIKEFCRRKAKEIELAEKRKDQELAENNAEMDEIVAQKRREDHDKIMDDIVAQKRQEDRDKIMDDIVAAKWVADHDQSDGQSDGSEAVEFFGNLLGGILSGLSGGSGGSVDRRSGGGSQCAAIADQIRSQRNYRNANRHASASVQREIQRALNQNIATYNKYCR